MAKKVVKTSSEKYLCDQMLGTLAKWLRLLGFDTFYANAAITDDELIEIAKKENRTIISRDKQLLIRGKKEKLPVIAVTNTDLDEQLKQVVRKAKIDEKTVLSRCSLCNTILSRIEKDRIEKQVPKRVFENNDEFWFCSHCNKIYWKGSHYEKITNKLNHIKTQLS